MCTIVLQGLHSRYLVTQGYQAGAGIARCGVLVDARRGRVDVCNARAGVQIGATPQRVGLELERQAIEVRTT